MSMLKVKVTNIDSYNTQLKCPFSKCCICDGFVNGDSKFQLVTLRSFVGIAHCFCLDSLYINQQKEERNNV